MLLQSTSTNPVNNLKNRKIETSQAIWGRAQERGDIYETNPLWSKLCYPNLTPFCVSIWCIMCDHALIDVRVKYQLRHLMFIRGVIQSTNFKDSVHCMLKVLHAYPRLGAHGDSPLIVIKKHVLVLP